MKLDDGFPQFVEVFCILMQKKKKKKIWGVQSDKVSQNIGEKETCSHM